MSQVVEVSVRPGRAYAYRWDGKKPLAIGDRVVVPAPPWMPYRECLQSVGPVVALGSDYDGPLTAIIEKA